VVKRTSPWGGSISFEGTRGGAPVGAERRIALRGRQALRTSSRLRPGPGAKSLVEDQPRWSSLPTEANTWLAGAVQIAGGMAVMLPE
jgi:hypothetical protein